MKIYRDLSKTLLAIILSLSVLPFTTSVLAGGPPQSGDFTTGANVWRDNCGRCHNIRDARELRDDQWYSTAFHMRIRGGLTGQETRDVIAFLTASNKPARKTIIADTKTTSSLSASTLSGEAIYNQTCIACHGADGKGTLPGAPDFSNPQGSLSQSDDVLVKHVTEGFQSPGSPMAMPAKGGNTALTEADIRAVVRYLRQFNK